MNQNSKTFIFVILASVVVFFVWMSRPTLPTAVDSEDMRGKRLFPNFNSALDATKLEIITYDEDTVSIRPFEVAMLDRRWVIPSHGNYPADAKDQMANVAASVMGLSVLDVASTDTGDFELYGVVDPDPKTLKAGTTGIGMKVIMDDKDNKTLMALVIGKEVPGSPKLRYVRRPGQDVIYTVELSTESLSTRFEDWIEADLLKLNTWDIRQVEINDYSVDEVNSTLVRRGEMVLDYEDPGTPKWSLAKDRAFKGGQWVAVKLGTDEELNTVKLDGLQKALGDLKIVDVARKPAGLSADLKADESFLNNTDAVASLASCGFYVAKLNGKVQVVSNEGDIRCQMNDGVQYVLRFGEIAPGSGSSGSNGAGKEEGDGNAKSGMNRYIFVTTEFNPDAVKRPELTPLPEAEAAKDGGAVDSEAKKAEVAAERKRIEKSNKRKQEEYEEKIKAGKKRVEELNARFADWYFIIPNSVYGQIHLSREDIVQKNNGKGGDKMVAPDMGLPPGLSLPRGPE